MVTFPGGVTVTYRSVTLAAGRDGYGNDTFDHSDHELDNVVFVPGQTTESAQGGEQVIGNAKLYVPQELFDSAGIAPGPFDKVLYNGHTYNIGGDPETWVSPFTTVRSPVSLNLREVTGGSSHTGTGALGGGNTE
jgi:hypothetical protein